MFINISSFLKKVVSSSLWKCEIKDIMTISDRHQTKVENDLDFEANISISGPSG